MSLPPRAHDGLSPSSLALFNTCRRQYFLKKVAKVPIDEDASDDTEAFQVGKAFHKCLEDTMHVLDGYTYDRCNKVVTEEFDLDATTTPMIFAMLGKYRLIHAQAGLDCIAVEQPIDTPTFYGIVDAVLQARDGSWWVSDSKTASSYSPSLPPTLPYHPQLNLYAAHAGDLAKVLCLDPEKFKGCRYRLVTKSRIAMKKSEGLQNYISRLGESCRGFDFVLPKEIMVPAEVAAQHLAAKRHIDTFKDAEDYAPNYGSCMNYFRPCVYWGQCHSTIHSKSPELKVFTS